MRLSIHIVALGCLVFAANCRENQKADSSGAPPKASTQAWTEARGDGFSIAFPEGHDPIERGKATGVTWEKLHGTTSQGLDLVLRVTHYSEDLLNGSVEDRLSSAKATALAGLGADVRERNARRGSMAGMPSLCFDVYSDSQAGGMMHCLAHEGTRLFHLYVAFDGDEPTSIVNQFFSSLRTA